MSLYDMESGKTEKLGDVFKKPISTVSIFLEDKQIFTHVKSIMMKQEPKILDAQVVRDLLQCWIYVRNDAN